MKERIDDGDGEDAVLHRMESLAELMEEGQLPDNDWLLLLLSKMPGDSCPIFGKGYRYVRPPSARARPEILLYDEDCFFEGLPELNPNDIRRHNQLRVPKAVRL